MLHHCVYVGLSSLTVIVYNSEFSLSPGSDEASNLRDPAVEAGGLLHHVRLRVQGGLAILTLARVPAETWPEIAATTTTTTTTTTLPVFRRHNKITMQS